MILIDMHVHSCYSDGTFTPEQLVSAARRRGLSLPLPIMTRPPGWGRS
ncbi:MAG: PHP domain-containing protein [Cloacibacillus evryensis]